MTSIPRWGGVGLTRRGVPGGHGVVSNVRVFGVEECLIKLGLVNKVARIHLGYLAHASAENVAERARENIYKPGNTGNLASGTKAEQEGPYMWTVTSSSMEGDVAEKNSYEYASYVEFGTSTTGTDYPSFAYMTRAYNETLPEVVAALKIIGETLERL